MEKESATPDKKLKSLLSSFISNPLNEYGRKRKRSLTETQSEKFGTDINDTERRKNIDSQDENAFFDRVESYDMMSWFAKPIELSPLVCSKYGWKNTESDMLQCVGCKAVLCGQLPKRGDSLIYHESCRKLKDNLRTSHQKSCFWPAYPSPESFMSIPVTDKRRMISDFIVKIDTLQKLQNSLPQVSSKSFDDKGVTANYLEEMKCEAENHLQHIYLDNIELGTFCMAVTGWTLQDEKAGVLSCHYCRRRVGLWNYKSKDSRDIDSEDSDEDIHVEIDSTDSQLKTIADISEGQQVPVNSVNIQQIHVPLTVDNFESQERPVLENSNLTIQTELFSEKDFSFSQPNIIDYSDSPGAHDEDTFKISKKSYDKSFNFSQPNILNGNEICNFKIEKTTECDSQCNNVLEKGLNGREFIKVEDEDNDHKLIPLEKGYKLESENQTNSENHLLSDSEKVCLLKENSSNLEHSDVNNQGSEQEQASLNHLNSNSETSSVQNNDVVETIQAPKRKKIKVVRKDGFDPLGEHRYWCPWINEIPESVSFSPQKISDQEGEKKTICPWQYILQIISPSFYHISHEDSVSEHFKQHSPVAGLRQLRKLMKDWSN